MNNYTPEEVKELELTDEDKDLIWASGHYLTEHFPSDEFKEWGNDEIEEWIDEHRWEPFEYYSTRDIYEMIDSLAFSVRRYIKND